MFTVYRPFSSSSFANPLPFVCCPLGLELLSIFPFLWQLAADQCCHCSVISMNDDVSKFTLFTNDFYLTIQHFILFCMLMSVLISKDCKRAEKQHRAVRWGRRGDPVGGFLTRLAPFCSSALFNATSLWWWRVALIGWDCTSEDPSFSALFFCIPLILCITSEGASRAMPSATRDVSS